MDDGLVLFAPADQRRRHRPVVVVVVVVVVLVLVVLVLVVVSRAADERWEGIGAFGRGWRRLADGGTRRDECPLGVRRSEGTVGRIGYGQGAALFGAMERSHCHIPAAVPHRTQLSCTIAL